MLGRALLAIGVCVLVLAFVRFLVKEEGLDKKNGKPFVGTWKLIDEQTVLPDGTVIPHRGSSAPIGLLVYDDSGHVTSQLVRPNTTKRAVPSDLDNIRDEEKSVEYEGYFGTYAVDTANTTITCHLDAALPNENTGKDIAEEFSIVGNKLIMRSHTSGPDAMPATRVLVWSRVN